VLRHPESSVQTDIAYLARAAAENDCIGYDQSERTTFWQKLKVAPNYDPKNITEACEADCSSGVAAIVAAAGYRTGHTALRNIDVAGSWTGNLRNTLKGLGFSVYTDSKYLTSDSYLAPGDILLNDSAHVATNLSWGACCDKSTSTVEVQVTSGTWVAGTYVTVVSNLNVRQGPSTSYSKKSKLELTKDGQAHSNAQGQLNQGTAVTVYETAVDGSNIWGRIPSGWIALYYAGKAYAKLK
jgi:hypothetical protein